MKVLIWFYQGFVTLRLKIAQKPYIVWSLGSKALKYESLEPWGKGAMKVLIGFYEVFCT